MADKLVMYGGEYKVFACSATEDGVAIVLTGAAIYFAISEDIYAKKRNVDITELVSISTVGGGITITDGAAGTFEIELASSDTENLQHGTYKYGVQAILSGYTDPVVLDVGTIEILASYVMAV